MNIRKVKSLQTTPLRDNTVNGNKLKQAARNFQKGYLLKALRVNHGNVSITAKRLGIHRNTIILKIKEFKIENNIKEFVKERKDKGINLISSLKIKLTKKNKLKEATYKYEKRYLRKFIRKANGNVLEVARMLGTHRNTINNKVADYNLKDYIEDKRWKRRSKNNPSIYYHTVIKPRIQAGCTDKETRLIGKRIKEARLKAGLSQVKLAAMAGINQSMLCHAERGIKKLGEKAVKRLKAALSIKH